MAEQLCVFGTDPLQMAYDACDWAREGYGRADGNFFALINLCESAAASGIPVVRRGDIYILAQQAGLPVSMCEAFRFDNNIWSALSRYMLMFRPYLAKVIHPKRADIDTIDLQRVWRERVCATTVFLADSWQDARLAFEAGDISAIPWGRR